MTPRLATALAVLIAAGAAVWFLSRGDGAEGRAESAFAGADACAACHPDQYARWRDSTHGRAGGAPSDARLLGAFDGRTIRFRDARVTPHVDDAGRYGFRVEADGWPPVDVEVVATVGAGHLEGGGTQGLLTPWPDGTLRFLPFDFARQQGVWFCDTGPRAGRGWVPLGPDLSLFDCADWPPTRAIGGDVPFARCDNCHASNLRVAFDANAGRYTTRFQDLAIDCESCHGPAGRHVESALAGRLDADAGMPSLAALGTDASIEVCLACHAVKSHLREGWQPGKSLLEHYSLGLPILEREEFHPDGRVRIFAYQANHRASDCYRSGSMTCVDCHEPHGQTYRDVWGRPLEGRFADGQCTGCHPSKTADPPAHTFHPPESAGSRCVACHMPYLQHPGVGPLVRYGRSDHSIPIPRPAFDASLGIRDACSGCHADRSPAEHQQQVEAWWGKLKPHPPAVAALLDGEGDALLAPEAAGSHHPMAQLMALAAFADRHLPPSTLPAGTEAGLAALAANPDPDVAASALALLRLLLGDDARASIDTGPEDRARRLRPREALALFILGDRARHHGDATTAVSAYRTAADLDAGADVTGRVLSRLALLDPERAVRALRRRIERGPPRPGPWVNLGIAYQTLGRSDDAADAWRRAIELHPHEALAHFDLGNHHLLRGELAHAASEYELAIRDDPGMARAHQYAARAHLGMGEIDAARASVRRALQLAPTDEAARELERLIESRGR